MIWFDVKDGLRYESDPPPFTCEFVDSYHNLVGVYNKKKKIVGYPMRRTFFFELHNQLQNQCEGFNISLYLGNLSKEGWEKIHLMEALSDN